MHDYTVVRLIQNERMTQFEREADAARLASEAKRGLPRPPHTSPHRSLLGLTRALGLVRVACGGVRLAPPDVTPPAE